MSIEQKLEALNLSLLLPTKETVRNLTPITVLDIFDGMSKNFHNDGLFSTTIFGRIGEERRNRTFSYINLNIPIFHPKVYETIAALKGLYEGIINGTKYAVFDEKTKDFIESDIASGETGFSFFVSKLDKLKPEERDSPKRDFYIKLFNLYKNNMLFEYLPVMPAGLRDYVVDENGKPSEDEINKLYRTVLSISNMMGAVTVKGNEHFLDKTRYNLQKSVNEIYEYIRVMLDGKSKFILGKWAARKLYHSTRNVLSSVIPKPKSFRDNKIIGPNHTTVGIYQFLRAALPWAINRVKGGYSSSVFTGPNTPAILVNRKTLKKEMVYIDPIYYDKWMTFAGLEKTFSEMGQESLLNKPIVISDHYFGLLYNNPEDETFRFLNSIDEAPPEINLNYIKPITYAELFYLSVYKEAYNLPCFMNRYPVSGYGGIYPSMVYLMSTVNSVKRTELDEFWKPTNDVAREFPITGERFFNTLAPSIPHIQALAADFDGDTGSFIILYSDEAIEEVKKTLNSKNYYMDITGRMVFSYDTHVIGLVLKSMTI